MTDYILVKQFALDNNLTVLSGENGLDKKITSEEITRCGLEFAGFYNFFEPDRVILIGSKEACFLETLDEKTARDNVETIFKKLPPCLIFTTNVNVLPIFYEMSKKYNVAILKSNLRTTQTSTKLYTYLQDHLAPRISVHATLMDINGMGTLLIGKSGIGKSEVALDLIKRGHQLVADDLVDIMEKEPGNLIGTAPDVLQRYMEIRGIGIVDVVTMFGACAYRERKNIRLVVELEMWDKKKPYDRLGLDTEKEKFFNTEIAKVTIPVLPGRTVSLLVESAAMNEKLKFLGHNAASDFVEKVNKLASRKEGENV